MSSQLIKEFKKDIQARIENLSLYVIQGKCTSFDDYKSRCRELHAYHESLHRFNEIAEQIYNPPQDKETSDDE